MSIEGGIVFPTGMNEEGAGSGFFLIKMDVEAAGLAASGFQDGQQLFAQLLLLPRPGVKANENVKGQASSFPLH